MSTITAGSNPLFLAICFTGSSNAVKTIFAPSCSPPSRLSTSFDTLGITFGVFSDALKMIPLYSSGFGWVIVASGMMLVSILVDKMKNIHASETQNA